LAVAKSPSTPFVSAAGSQQALIQLDRTLSQREAAARKREMIKLLVSDYHYTRDEAERFLASFNREPTSA
jgi:hypothetical protein